MVCGTDLITGKESLKQNPKDSIRRVNPYFLNLPLVDPWGHHSPFHPNAVIVAQCGNDCDMGVKTVVLWTVNVYVPAQRLALANFAHVIRRDR